MLLLEVVIDEESTKRAHKAAAERLLKELTAESREEPTPAQREAAEVLAPLVLAREVARYF